MNVALALGGRLSTTPNNKVRVGAHGRGAILEKTCRGREGACGGTSLFVSITIPVAAGHCGRFSSEASINWFIAVNNYHWLSLSSLTAFSISFTTPKKRQIYFTSYE
jgi:hypothetical protein